MVSIVAALLFPALLLLAHTSSALEADMMITGNSACPCVNVEEYIAKQTQDRCELEDGTQGTLFSSNCYPLNFGSQECRRWNEPYDAACKSANPPQWCRDSWCYVDGEKCHSSKEIYYKSTSWKGLFYSFSTCGSNADSWIRKQTTQVLANTSLTVGIPDIWFPVHYKLDAYGDLVENDSPDAYDPAVAWRGTVLDYFNDIAAIAGMEVKYIHRSRGSQFKNISTSAYTQAVSDSQTQIVDAVIGTVWVTAERLRMTPFTIPIIRDTFELWVPIKDQISDAKSVKENFQRLKQPFSDGLWWAIIGSILVYAILSAYVSPRKFRQFSNRKTSFWGKTKRAAIILTDAFHLSSLEFLGGAVDTGVREANLSQKWLNLGFAMVIFLSITAYTANLVAFLTLRGATTVVSNMEEATKANMRVCANTNMKGELTARYPHTDFYWSKARAEVQEDYDKGKCGGIVQGWVDTYIEPEAQLWYCDRGLTRVGAPLLDFPIAFPASTQVVGGLSHWIAEAANQGIVFEDYVRRTPLKCALEVEAEGGEDEVDLDLLQFTLANMQVPFIAFLVACSMALLTKLWKWLYYRKGDKTNGVRAYVRTSMGISKKYLGGSKKSLDDEIHAALSSSITNKTSITSGSTLESDEKMPLRQDELVNKCKARRSSLPRRLPKASKVRSVDDMNRAIAEYLDYQQQAMNEQRQSMEELLAYQQSLLRRSEELSSPSQEHTCAPQRHRQSVKFDVETFEDEYIEIGSKANHRQSVSYHLDNEELEQLSDVDV